MKRSVPANTINTVLFVWGPGRIVPVRVTALTVTERLYDIVLNPTKAEVQIDAARAHRRRAQARHGHARAGSPTPPTRTRRACARRSRVANLVNAGESILGMLPI